jgi:hypothetical protein
MRAADHGVEAGAAEIDHQLDRSGRQRPLARMRHRRTLEVPEQLDMVRQRSRRPMVAMDHR